MSDKNGPTSRRIKIKNPRIVATDKHCSDDCVYFVEKFRRSYCRLFPNDDLYVDELNGVCLRHPECVEGERFLDD